MNNTTTKKNAGSATKAGKSNAVKAAAPNKTATKSGSTSTKNVAAKAPAKAGKASGKAATRPQSADDLDEIFHNCLKDIYWAEKHLSKALPKMAKAASNPQLVDAFTVHKEQTLDQISKLEQAFEMLGYKAQAKKCDAMEGLVKEGAEQIEEYEKGAGRDAALIVAAQKAEHYEISAYGSLRTFAHVLGHHDVEKIFDAIREQEADTDELLSTIAHTVNKDAIGDSEVVNEGEDDEVDMDEDDNFDGDAEDEGEDEEA